MIVIYINLTPHPVVLYSDDRVVQTIASSGTVARLAEESQVVWHDGAVARTRVRLGAIQGLPEPRTGTVYVLSMPLLMSMAAAGLQRPDCVYPYGQVRDDQGRIIGCQSLAYIASRCDSYGCADCPCRGELHGQCNCEAPCPCVCEHGCVDLARRPGGMFHPLA